MLCWIYGPVTLIEESTDENDEFRQADYIFDYSKGRGSWSQLYCDEHEFNKHFADGYYNYIFDSMMDFL